MIPVNLKIKGFLSYKEEVEINFERLHLASITGANGAGKSSILDAITWSLFGYARARNEQVINQQSELADVSLDFSYEQQLFRVRRTNQISKPATLEFYIFDTENQVWRPLTEHSVTETQKRIKATLRMDYDTFINASFFLQGKADQFTQLTSGERKNILSNILGLEIWEEYLKKARDVRRELESEQTGLESILAEIEKEIDGESQIKDQLAQARVSLDQKISDKSRQQKIIEQATQLENAKTAAKKQIDQLKDEIDKFKTNIDKNNVRKQHLSSQIAELKSQVKSAPEIEEKFINWQLIRKQLEDSNQKYEQYAKTSHAIDNVSHQIQMEETNLKHKMDSLTTARDRILEHNKNLPGLEKELAENQVKLKELTTRIDKKGEQNKKITELRAELTKYSEEIKRLEKLNKEAREKYKEFRDAGPECPFCNQPLTKDHREKYEAHIVKEGQERNNLIEIANREIDEIKKQIHSTEQQIKEIESYEKKAIQVQKLITKNELLVQSIKDEITQWENSKAQDFQITYEKLENKSYLANLQPKLDKLTSEIKELDFNEEKHNKLKLEVTNLAGIEQKYQEVNAAKSKLEPIQKQFSELEGDLKVDEKELETKLDSLEKQQADFEELYSQMLDLNRLKRDLDEIDKEISLLDKKEGAEKQKLEAIANQKKNKEKHLINLDELKIQISQYHKLEEAFGKKGVPALLIEQALPEIEAHANELLDRLTYGQLSIHFETQSEYKDKKREDKKETLDILINDANGYSRAYEMFSGGESFRINFAIRLALSQVLAKRSGARLQTLVIDEGFGSQDNAGRDRLVETINVVKKDFSKILIITHLEELKDAFPGRIEVEKTSTGSQAEVMVY